MALSWPDFLLRSMGHFMCRVRCNEAVKEALCSPHFIDDEKKRALQHRSMVHRGNGSEAVLHVLRARLEGLVGRGVSATPWELLDDMEKMAAAINDFLKDESSLSAADDLPFYADLLSLLRSELALAATFLESPDLRDNNAEQSSGYTEGASPSSMNPSDSEAHTFDAQDASNDLLDVSTDEETTKTYVSNIREEVGKSPATSSDAWILSAIGSSTQEDLQAPKVGKV